MKNPVEVVYFFWVDESRIKIGWSTDFEQRLASHCAPKLGVKIDVKPLCVLRGCRSDEGVIHRYFAKFLLEGEEEVYQPAEPLIDYIRWLRSQHFCWAPPPERYDRKGKIDPSWNASEVEDLALVDSSNWAPSPERKLAAPSHVFFSDFGSLRLPVRAVTTDDFYTSPKIIKVVRDFYGGCIDLDPASHAHANKVVKATEIFTLNDDGLSREWYGDVWLNPPFSQWGKWVPKIIREWERGRVRQMCVLAATRTMTAKHFQPINERCSVLCIFRGRIAFWGHRATSSPDEGHAIFYFGENVDKFKEVFSGLGTIWARAILRKSKFHLDNPRPLVLS